MSCKIQLLDELTVNQIAAGEVVENASCVVKELVENSLDAGADQIVIDLLNSGRQSIKVIDNGSGMSGQDARLCFERHATSKIRSVDQLPLIDSMGFRGEALASIASVSKTRLWTSDGGENASFFALENGRLLCFENTTRDIGTTVEVLDLFYNVPARRKFQKSASYDEREIVKTVTQLALGNPYVSFHLLNDKRTLLQAPSCAKGDFLQVLEKRIEDVFGFGLLEKMQRLSFKKEGLQIDGFIGLPAWSRQNRSGQHLFLKRRPIQSPLISSAILQGYGTMLASRRFPLFIIHADLLGQDFDINVHPQKKQVRLRKERLVKEWIVQGVQDSFIRRQPQLLNLPWEQPSCFWQETKDPVISPTVEKIPAPCAPSFEPQDTACEQPPLFSPDIHLLSCWEGYLLVDGKTMPPECEPGLVLVSVKGAQMRVLFEQYMKTSHPCASQRLLLPQVISLTTQEAEQVRLWLPEFSALGFELRPFGPSDFLLEAVAADVMLENAASVMEDFLQQMLGAPPSRKKLAMKLAQVASTVKKDLDRQESLALLQRLFMSENPYLTPLGEATMTTITPQECSRRFR